MGNNIKYFTVKELAEILQLHENTVLKMLDTGELKGFKVGRAWRMLECDLPKPKSDISPSSR